jgi:Flp pilus assembly CpaF family ATPase
MLTVSKQPFSLVRQVLQAAPLTLDADQQAVVAHRGSPIVVQGGPGTGKTTVLVEAALGTHRGWTKSRFNFAADLWSRASI